MAGLKITTGVMQGQRIECDRRLVIGREESDGVDVVIDDAEMSRRHAAVTPVADGLEIEDLGSLNGTFVNGNRISGKVILEPNAEVKLGTTRFTVDLPPVEAPVVSPANPTMIRQSVTPASDEPVAPIGRPTVVRDQPVAPAAAADTPAPAADTPSAEPVAPIGQPTVARSAPIVPDMDKTAVRDQPVISSQEPTVVRDAMKGLPTAQPPGGPGPPAGGPPKIPAPARMVMKSPARKLLLPIMLKLPPKARPIVPLLFLLLIVAAIAVVVILVVT
jgi:pSer/pThr/pTyr-binding forkhead associated (FHA) protein